jgi:PAS domain-containing protein
VSYFAAPLQARHMFVNPQLCRLVGHSQEDLLFSKPPTFIILVRDKTWLLHQLRFGTG